MIIEEVIPKSDYILLVVAANKQSGLFDVSPYLDSEVFSMLKDADNFCQIRNGKYFVEWKCGADLSADTIEAKWEKIA